MYKYKDRKIRKVCFNAMRLALCSFRYALSALLFSLCVMPYALYADIQFKATVDSNTVSLGSTLQLNLSFYGIQNIPAPEITSIDGFTVRYIGPSTKVSIVNGRMSESITHIYNLLPLKTGTFKIGPFSVNYKGKVFTSNPITVNVVSSGSGPPPSAGQSQRIVLNSEELKDKIFVTMETSKTKAYLNESIPLKIKLYISQVNARDIQYPEFEHKGFSTAEFGKPKQYRQVLNGVLYNISEFDTRIFAVKPGKLTLGPAVIKCNLIVKKEMPRRNKSIFDDDFFGGGFDNGIFDDFFGNYQLYPFKVSSPEIFMNILPYPEEEKPSDFKGAIGDFTMEAKVSPDKVNVGDPITLTMTIKGNGNFDTVTCPELKSNKDFKIYEPHKKDSAGGKTFEQILMPLSDNVKYIPEISFSFFNPYDGKYHTIRKGPFPIVVKASSNGEAKIVGPLKRESETYKSEDLGKDIVYIKENPGKLRKEGDYFYKSPGYWIFQLAVLLIFSGWIAFYKHNQRLKNDARYARLLAAPRKAREGIKSAGKMLEENNVPGFFDAVFETMRDYITDKLRIPPGNVTQNTVDEALKSIGVNEDTRGKIKSIFDDCDIARYAPSNFSKERMKAIFEDMRQVINYMEKKKI